MRWWDAVNRPVLPALPPIYETTTMSELAGVHWLFFDHEGDLISYRGDSAPSYKVSHPVNQLRMSKNWRHNFRYCQVLRETLPHSDQWIQCWCYRRGGEYARNLGAKKKKAGRNRQEYVRFPEVIVFKGDSLCMEPSETRIIECSSVPLISERIYPRLFFPVRLFP